MPSCTIANLTTANIENEERKKFLLLLFSKSSDLKPAQPEKEKRAWSASAQGAVGQGPAYFCQLQKDIRVSGSDVLFHFLPVGCCTILSPAAVRTVQLVFLSGWRRF